jgi:hypothetical protein
MRVAASMAASAAGGAASTAALEAGGAASTAQSASTPAAFKYWQTIFTKRFKNPSLLNKLVQSCFEI